jgi:hypothetical protein
MEDDERRRFVVEHYGWQSEHLVGRRDAIAPSDPNVIYVGGGKPTSAKTGRMATYRSTDAGQRGRIGLDDARHRAHRRRSAKSDDVYVAAMGHASGPNSTRGVYRSRDGSKSWQRVLFVDDSTGAVDLSMDPSNPHHLRGAVYAALALSTAGGGRAACKPLTATAEGISFSRAYRRIARPHRHLGVPGKSAARIRDDRVSTGGFDWRHLPLG